MDKDKIDCDCKSCIRIGGKKVSVATRNKHRRDENVVNVDLQALSRAQQSAVKSSRGRHAVGGPYASSHRPGIGQAAAGPSTSSGIGQPADHMDVDSAERENTSQHGHRCV